MPRVDLTGQRFGRLTVIRPAGTNRHQKRQWECLCECGARSFAATGDLRSGQTVSCGCSKKGRGRPTHKGSKLPEYQVWCGMKARCFNPNHFAYEYYGGRGITVCKRWKDDFMAFLSDMGPRPTPEHTLERINNNKGYSPDNCEWASRAVQSNNTRPRRLKTHCKRGHPLSGENIVLDRNGIRKCLACRKILWRNWSKKNRRKNAEASP